MHLDRLLTKGRALLCVLIDPEKSESVEFDTLLQLLAWHPPDLILIGGSSYVHQNIERLVQRIRKQTRTPILLFPGGPEQLTPEADGVLLCSLISGRNPEYLIGRHVDSAFILRSLNLPIWSVGYILVEGDASSSTESFTQTTPIDKEDISLIVRTALAGEYLGMHAIYLEAGSGAETSINLDIISAVSRTVECPVIVGGGLKSRRDVENAFDAGADLVVIGTALEKNPELLSTFTGTQKLEQLP